MTTTITADAAPPAPASFALVPFRDTQILAARVDQDVRVPMKRFCGTIGLPWEPQRKRIERNAVLAEGASMMEVPSEGGLQQQMTLPLGLLSGFLVGVDASRLAPERREAVLAFQREAYAVLHQHFFGRPAAPAALPVVARPPALPGWAELDAARRHAPALIEAISAERRPSVRRYLYQLLTADCDRLGLDAPALVDLGEDAPTADALIDRLFAGLRTLEARKIRWNHFGRGISGRAAILLPEIAWEFQRADIDVAIDDELRAALRCSSIRYRITEETIRSDISRKPVLATVIAPWPGRGGIDG